MIEDLAFRYGADTNGLVTVQVGPGQFVTVTPDRHAEIVIRAHWHRRDVAASIPTSQAVGVSVQAQVNDNRWLAVCPSCGSAQYTSKTDRRFFCIDCLNSDWAGQWLAVTWPDDPTVTQVETVLGKRPLRTSRSWSPTETVADLVAENAEHGVA